MVIYNIKLLAQWSAYCSIKWESWQIEQGSKYGPLLSTSPSGIFLDKVSLKGYLESISLKFAMYVSLALFSPQVWKQNALVKFAKKIL